MKEGKNFGVNEIYIFDIDLLILKTFKSGAFHYQIIKFFDKTHFEIEYYPTILIIFFLIA